LTEPRKHEKYDALIYSCHALAPVRTAVAHPCDETSLVGALDAAPAKIIKPILVGPEAKVRALAASLSLDLAVLQLVITPHSHAAAEKAVEIVRAGEADALMKGSLHTDELMTEVVRKDTGLRTERRISHVFIMDVPTYPKPIFITDIFPSLEDKADIVRNAIDLAQSLGIAVPKVAILSAVETITSKIPSTIDAAALCKMADREQITGALLDGPLALDNAISREAAAIKHIRSPVAGDADILLVPDLEAGNMLAKELSFLSDADAAGIVLGARVPIILNQPSRQCAHPHGKLRGGCALRPRPQGCCRRYRQARRLGTVPKPALISGAISRSAKFSVLDFRLSARYSRADPLTQHIPRESPSGTFDVLWEPHALRMNAGRTDHGFRFRPRPVLWDFGACGAGRGDLRRPRRDDPILECWCSANLRLP